VALSWLLDCLCLGKLVRTLHVSASEEHRELVWHQMHTCMHWLWTPRGFRSQEA
jgi:hypothetical protein